MRPAFGRRQRRAEGGRVPVTILTGGLGAGKTTVLRELLATPEGAGSAIVVNEFADLGIDDLLLRSGSDATRLLGNGCLCCQMRADLDETLRGLVTERGQGLLPPFKQVLIETSGLADPGPVLQTFMTSRGLSEMFHLRALVTIVDAVLLEATLGQAPEYITQIALADRILLTKTDLLADEDVASVIERLAALNHDAPLRQAVLGKVDPDFVLGQAASTHSGRVADSGEHSLGIQSFSISLNSPLHWAGFARAIDALMTLRGEDLLRVKGLLNIEGCAGPVIVHAVQHLAHPPVELQDWPDGNRQSRLVFITRRITREMVLHVLQAMQALAAPVQTLQ